MPCNHCVWKQFAFRCPALPKAESHVYCRGLQSLCICNYRIPPPSFHLPLHSLLTAVNAVRPNCTHQLPTDLSCITTDKLTLQHFTFSQHTHVMQTWKNEWCFCKELQCEPKKREQAWCHQWSLHLCGFANKYSEEPCWTCSLLIKVPVNMSIHKV